MSGAVVAAAVAAIAVSLLGGSARYDAWQIALLQPIAILITCYCAFKVSRADLRRFRAPLALLAALAVLMVLQLVPLPQALWSHLPGRQVVMQVQAALGFETAREISLVPSRTLNALFGLAIPACALFTYLALDAKSRSAFALGGFILIAFVSAGFGALQILGPADSWMYTYRISNFGKAVGLFANANHAAFFASLALAVIGYCLVAAVRAEAGVRKLAPLVATLAFVFVIGLLSGSRLGLLTLAVALIATGAAYLADAGRGGASMQGKVRFVVAGCFVAAIAMIGLLFFAADRIPALEEMVADSPMEDMRVRILGTLVRMAGEYFPVGAGFGSFESVYYIAEPDSELRPTYLNMAHNDWLQYVIESGLPGIAVLVAALVWLARTGTGLARSGTGADRPALIAFAAGAVIVALASLFDYPLRAPLFQFACVWLLACAWEFASLRTVTEAGD